jgi:pyrroline-5-carboxylate reductase
MGSSLLSRWLSKDLISVSDMLVVEPDSSALKNIEKSRRPRQVKSIADIEALKEPVCVVLAIKPQQFEHVVAFLAVLPYGSIVLAVAAGIRISRFRQVISPFVGVVRAMPNLPAAIGAGVTALFADERTTKLQKSVCDEIMQTTGKTLWVRDENDLDAVTALSGSGPAYVFLLIEILAKIGGELGLEADVAAQLASATVYGAGRLADESDKSAGELRADVTRPGGTTEAALEILMGAGGIEVPFRSALHAAKDRARQL